VNRVLSVLIGVLLLSSQFPAMADSDTGDNDAGLRYWNEIKREAVETESGLQYKALITGKGRKPGPSSKVKVHYRGLLLNGVTFDSSFSEDEPVSMSLKKVIKGWQEGIQLMPTGSVFVFLIPPELAYGTKGSGVIPPNATLIFEVELFKK
jgi:FKBP-type peptidyl-prolyl cis-trans isomerase FkpA